MDSGVSPIIHVPLGTGAGLTVGTNFCTKLSSNSAHTSLSSATLRQHAQARVCTLHTCCIGSSHLLGGAPISCVPRRRLVGSLERHSIARIVSLHDASLHDNTWYTSRSRSRADRRARCPAHRQCAATMAASPSWNAGGIVHLIAPSCRSPEERRNGFCRQGPQAQNSACHAQLHAAGRCQLALGPASCRGTLA